MTEGDVFITRRQAEALIEDRITQYLTKGNIPSSLIEGRHIASLSADKLAAGTISAAVSIGTGNISLDGVNSRILVGDGTDNRIVIDGTTGVMKVSRATYDVLTAANDDLIFSTQFGAIIETHYRITDQHRYGNHTDYKYHGPENAISGEPDPIVIQMDSADFRDVEVYFEMNASGQDSAYCAARLYNLTTAAAISGSDIDSPTGSTPDRVRSGQITLTSGVNEYTVQYKRVNGDATDYPGIMDAKLIIRTTA